MSESALSANSQPVHLAVTVTVREGKEAEFAALLLKFAKRSLDHQGTTGVHFIQPVPGTGCREFGILRSFKSESHISEFYSSEMYQQHRRDTADLVEGEPVFRPLHGLEAFFRAGGTMTPPRWKMALLTYFGVLPAALLWSNTLKPLLSDFHWLIGVMFTNAAVVITLAWVLMPTLTRWFQPWLYAGLSKNSQRSIL